MCTFSADEGASAQHRHGRRTFLRSAGGVAAVGLIGGSLVERDSYADSLTREQRDAMSPEAIMDMLRHGNERFCAGDRKPRDFLREQAASAAGQYPAAVLLTCIDSRAPAEIIMDLGIGEVFNARVAGNVASKEMLGSLEFSCKIAGAKVVLVMGHTACGAIKGAIDRARLGHLTELLERIEPAVAATSFDGERTSKNDAFVDAVARTNVEFTMARIRTESTVLDELVTAGSLRIAGAMYDVAKGKVDFFT